jgi:hypothetical protein
MTPDQDQGGPQETGGGWYQPSGSTPPPPPPPPSGPPAGYGQPAPAYGQSVPPYGQTPKTEGTAVGALIVGIVGLFLFGIILGIVALVLANTANKRIQQSGGYLQGQGMVTAARILGVVDIVLAIIVIAVIVGNS